MVTKSTTIDTQRVRVTEWVFEIGDQTGQLMDEYDYIVVPMLYGELKIINGDNSIVVSKLFNEGSYLRNKGVNHNVINNNDFEYSFVEIEIK